MATLTYKKKIASYTGLARFYAEAENIGEVKRDALRAAGIRTPYASGPTVSAYQWQGLQVIVAETSHRTYEVWVVSADAVQPEGTDDAEFDAQMRASRNLSPENAQ